MAETTEEARSVTPCGHADPDEPCLCTPPEPRKTHAIRFSAEYVTQVRALGDRRFPLRDAAAVRGRATT